MKWYSLNAIVFLSWYWRIFCLHFGLLLLDILYIVRFLINRFLKCAYGGSWQLFSCFADIQVILYPFYTANWHISSCFHISLLTIFLKDKCFTRKETIWRSILNYVVLHVFCLVMRSLWIYLPELTIWHFSAYNQACRFLFIPSIRVI